MNTQGWLGTEEWVRRADELAPVFAERAAAHDRDGDFPFDNFENLRTAGFLAMTVPKEHGGAGESLGTHVGVLHALARGDGSTAMAVCMHFMVFGAERESPLYPPHWLAQMARGAVEHGRLCNTVASEEGLGSPAGGGIPETTARADGDGWLLSGRKSWTTMAPALYYFIVMARLDRGGETDSPAELANFMVFRDDPGLRIDETWDSLSMRSTGSHDTILESIRLTSDRMLGTRKLSPGAPRSGAQTAWFSLGLCGVVLGITSAARDFAVSYARERTPTGTETIKEHPGVRTRIARIDRLIYRSRAIVADAVDAWEQQVETGMKPIDRVVIAKVETLDACIEALELAMRVVGGASLLKRHPLERYFRDVRAALHNPPLEDRAMEQLAQSALK